MDASPGAGAAELVVALGTRHTISPIINSEVRGRTAGHDFATVQP